MKRFTFFVVLFLILSFLLVGCGGGQDSPSEEPSGKIEEKVKAKDMDDFLLTEKEIKSYLKAAPAYVKVMKELSEKYEGISTKNVMRGAVAAKKALREINSTLKPYGFTMESFFVVQTKVLGTYGYMMGLEAKEQAKKNIPQLKKMLNNPNITEEQKEDIKKSIEELEKEDDSEEAKAYRKNMKIVKEYKDKLDDLFSKLKEID
jgi:hypothetical protein